MRVLNPKCNALMVFQQALYLPDIEGKSLTGQVKHTTDMCVGRITILAMITTKISEVCTSYSSGLSAYAHSRFIQQDSRKYPKTASLQIPYSSTSK